MKTESAVWWAGKFHRECEGRSTLDCAAELVEAVCAEAVEHFARECAAKLREVAEGAAEHRGIEIAADIVEALAKGGVK